MQQDELDEIESLSDKSFSIKKIENEYFHIDPNSNHDENEKESEGVSD